MEKSQVTVIVMAIGGWGVVKSFEIVRVVGVLNPPAGIEGKAFGVTWKHGLDPEPQLFGSPCVIVIVGLSVPVPILLMHR